MTGLFSSFPAFSASITNNIPGHQCHMVRCRRPPKAAFLMSMAASSAKHICSSLGNRVKYSPPYLSNQLLRGGDIASSDIFWTDYGVHDKNPPVCLSSNSHPCSSYFPSSFKRLHPALTSSSFLFSSNIAIPSPDRVPRHHFDFLYVAPVSAKLVCIRRMVLTDGHKASTT